MTLLVGKLGTWTAALVLTAGGVNTGRVLALRDKAEQLSREAMEQARPNGCAKVEECKVVGFGHKACGGPREYIAYCSKTTDARVLQAKLAALEKAEKDWQQAAGIKSDCAVTPKPSPVLEKGMCRTQ